MPETPSCGECGSSDVRQIEFETDKMHSESHVWWRCNRCLDEFRTDPPPEIPGQEHML